MADAHGDGAEGQDGLAAQAVDVQDRWNRGHEHDDADDAGGEQTGGIGAQAERAEDLRRVVEDGVDASPLLKEHGDC